MITKPQTTKPLYRKHHGRHAKLRLFGKIVWRLIWIPFVTGLVTVLIGGAVAYFKVKPIVDATPAVKLSRLSASLSPRTSIEASDGTILWQSSLVKPELLSTKDVIPNFNLKKALLSVEDRQFYHEGGINYQGTLRAAFYDVMGHNKNQGGSTLTQQLVKLSYFHVGNQDKTWQRKIQEMVLADKIAKQLPKNEVLKNYMNKVYLGQGVFGMKTASTYYFGKNFNQLSIEQAALIAGMVQSPTAYDPYVHPLTAKLRRNTVLKTMWENNQITKQQYRKAITVPLKQMLVPLSQHQRRASVIQKRTYLTDSYITSVKQQLNRQNWSWQTGQQTIKTALDWPMQQWLAKALLDNDEMDLPNRQLQVGITVLNNHNGKVVAQVGNRHFNQLEGYNRATQTNRSSGSVIKPLLDYGPAIDQLEWGTNKMLDDDTLIYPHSNVVVHDWDGLHMGWMSAKQALILSRNIPAIKTLESVGLTKATQYAHAFGITGDINYPNAIGVNTSTEQMASAFSSLAQDGVQVLPMYATSIHQRHQLYKAQIMKQTVFSKQAAYMLTNALKGVPKPNQSGQAAQISGFEQAGKTGTIAYDSRLNMPANSISDAWYTGYTKDYTVSVWVGYDNPNQRQYYLTNNDGDIPANIYKRIMLYLWHHKMTRNVNWSEPNGIYKLSNDTYDFTSVGHPTFVGTPVVK